jgi:1,4-alpha-glucan branching enzyme
LTIGFTPVLANQLDDPVFASVMEEFFQQRLEACAAAPSSLGETGDEHLLPLADVWRSRFIRLRDLFRSADGNLISAFRKLADDGRIEVVGSAATHGFLPLLGRDESIRFQLAVGRTEHRRLFGRDPGGCWLPECAYRPGGQWDPLPGHSPARERDGIELFLSDAGFRFVFLDAHLVEAGDPLGAYGDAPLGAERFDAERHRVGGLDGITPSVPPSSRSPYRAYAMGEAASGARPVAFVRDPRTSMQVWSRDLGYPGDEWYLEFHKIRWPGGLKFWRVTGPGIDLGAKGPYNPEAAAGRSQDHASHFASLLSDISRQEKGASGEVILSPFDTELFGHWWFEGVDFLGALYRRLRDYPEVRATTASASLESHPPTVAVQPIEGSWGANGDFSMWLNDSTRWTWERLWPLEDTFWRLAPAALGRKEARPILAQAARQLLLAQSSDWQFMISTGAVPDYAERRFVLHCDDLQRLLPALSPNPPADEVEKARALASELDERDRLFPDVFGSLEEVISHPNARAKESR